MAKILHIINPVERGGGESFISDLMANSCHENDLLMLSKSSYLTDKMDQVNCKVIFEPKNMINSPSDGIILKIYKTVRQCVYLFRERSKLDEYDLINVHSFPGFIVPALTNSACILTKHSIPSKKKLLIKLIYKYFYRQFVRIIAVSKLCAKRMNESYMVHCDIVENPVADAFFRVERLSDRRNNIKIIHVARNVSGKNQHLTVKSAAMFSNKHNVKCTIDFIGSDFDVATKQFLARSASELVSINYLGVISREHIAELLADADVGFLPSEFEGFGIAAAEYAATRLPIVGLSTSGISETFSGLGVFYSNEEELCMFSIEDALKLKECKKFKLSYQKVHSWQLTNVVDKYDKIYCESLR